MFIKILNILKGQGELEFQAGQPKIFKRTV